MPSADASPQTLAVLALGSISGLMGPVSDPPAWSLADLGDARWAGELVVNRLTELRASMRYIALAVR